MLKVKNLHVEIDGKSVLESITFEIPDSELHVIMGPNGSGKSSLAYSLMGHPKYSITNGSVLLNTQDLLSLPVEKRAREGLFLASQYPQTVPGVKVFTFLKEAHRMLTGQECSVSEFQDLINKVFELVGLHTSFAHRNLYDGFSGGEKKRLELAQLLLFKPRVAILDEIDSGLDVDAIKHIAAAIEHARSANPQLSILLITHYNRILEYLSPSCVYLLAGGKIVKSGDKSLAQIIEKDGYGSQRLQL